MRTQRQDTCWQENVEKCVNTCICGLLMILSIFMQQKYFFGFESHLLGVPQCLFSLYQRKQKKTDS